MKWYEKNHGETDTQLIYKRAYLKKKGIKWPGKVKKVKNPDKEKVLDKTLAALKKKIKKTKGYKVKNRGRRRWVKNRGRRRWVKNPADKVFGV